MVLKRQPNHRRRVRLHYHPCDCRASPLLPLCSGYGLLSHKKVFSSSTSSKNMVAFHTADCVRYNHAISCLCSCLTSHTCAIYTSHFINFSCMIGTYIHCVLLFAWVLLFRKWTTTGLIVIFMGYL